MRDAIYSATMTISRTRRRVVESLLFSTLLMTTGVLLTEVPSIFLDGKRISVYSITTVIFFPTDPLC